MTQRIADLADQSHKIAVEEYYKRMETEHPSQVIFYNIFNKIFAEQIIAEAVACCGSQADKKNIKKLFGLPVESNVKYPAPDAVGHYSQYERKYNIPKD